MKTINLKKNLIFSIIGVSLIGLSFTYSSLSDKAPKNKSIAKLTPPKVNLDRIALTNIEFDFDQSTISADSYKELDRVAKLLETENGSIQIAGHADNVGAYVYNWNLSKRRAQSVKKYLIDKGADASKIAATEFGDTKPIATNKTEEGRQKNRRVEMVFP